MYYLKESTLVISLVCEEGRNKNPKRLADTGNPIDILKIKKKKGKISLIILTGWTGIFVVNKVKIPRKHSLSFKLTVYR